MTVQEAEEYLRERGIDAGRTAEEVRRQIEQSGFRIGVEDGTGQFRVVRVESPQVGGFWEHETALTLEGDRGTRDMLVLAFARAMMAWESEKAALAGRSEETSPEPRLSGPGG